MGPIGCSWPIPALCIVKNIYYSLAALGLGCALGAFTAHRAGPFLAVPGAVAPCRVGSQLQTRSQSGVSCLARQSLTTGLPGRSLIPALEQGSTGLNLGAIPWLYDLG